MSPAKNHLRIFFLFAVAAVLILTAPRLPAPVQELPDPTPPGPSSSQTPKPNEKRSSAARSSSPAAKKPRASVSGKSSPPASTDNQRPNALFAGKWVGIMPEIPWGDVPTELLVDQSETTMEWQESGKRKGVARAELSGNTLRARFPAGMTTAIWSLTPQPDGVTAHVRLQAFMNDFAATFRRSGTAAKK